MKNFILSQFGLLTMWAIVFITFGILANWFAIASYIFGGFLVLTVLFIIYGTIRGVINMIKDRKK